VAKKAFRLREIQKTCSQLPLKYVRTSTSRVHASLAPYAVESKYNNTPVDVSNAPNSARASPVWCETSTDMLSYLLSTTHDVDGACTRDVDVRTYLRVSCKHEF